LSDYAARIQSFVQELSVAEREVFRQRLSTWIPAFFDETNQLKCSDKVRRLMFTQLATTLRILADAKASIPFNGVAYKGDAPWLTDHLLNELVAEAAARRHAPLDRIDHFLGCGGALADQLAKGAALNRFVARFCGPVLSSGIASYLYYDRPGLGIRPHVDTSVFSINLMIMLKHDPGFEMSSTTLVFPSNGVTERLPMRVGEVMIMHGHGVIHARSLLAPGETVHLLTIGFKPVVERMA
jgi:hypothetical protein